MRLAPRAQTPKDIAQSATSKKLALPSSKGVHSAKSVGSQILYSKSGSLFEVIQVVDALTLNFDALQRLSEALPKKGASLNLAESQSLVELVKGLADAIEESAPKTDSFISRIKTNWGSLSDEDIESFRSMAEETQTALEQIEGNDLSIRLLFLIPSIRRRKNLYKLLREPNERLVSTIATVVSAWETEREREFEEAASYVLQKNAELYRRLA